MAETIQSIMLAGNGFLRWPGHEQRVRYHLTVGLDSVVKEVHLATPNVHVLRRPGRTIGLYLHTSEGRRLALSVNPDRHVSPDGPLERTFDGMDWWIDSTPWLPFGTPGRVTLAMRRGPVQIFELHETEQQAEASFQQWRTTVDTAEIRPTFGRPIQLEGTQK